MKEISYEDQELFCEEDKKRLSRMLMLSRAESGLSQEKVSLELGVAKKTVQNWEKGISMPTLPQAVAWFRVMNVSAMPYFLQFMFPELEGVSSSDDDEQIRQRLMAIIDTLPVEGVRQLMFILYGNHGSSPRGVINMITAYLQTSLKDRYLIDNTILSSYRIANETDSLTKPNNVQPNEEIIEKTIERERDAIVNGRGSYIVI